MKLLFFGGDLPWSELVEYGFRRRNTWILKCFHDGKYFDEILILKEATRIKVLKEIFSPQKEKGIKDLYFTNICPHFFKGKLYNYINNIFNYLAFKLQGAGNINNSENIIWCYWPKGYVQAKDLKIKGRYFFDTDHNIIDDENLDVSKKNSQEKILLNAGKNSEKVISSVRSMLNWYKERGFDNLYMMRNGIDLERFKNTNEIDQSIKGPIIGYIGTISKWVNYEALKYLLKKHPDWNLLIYGSTFRNDISEDLRKFKNCHFMGPLLPKDVPKTMKSFDVGLNIYRKESWLDVDSMKIYEYLAAEVPVVSIKYHNNLKEDFDGLLYLVNDEKEMEKAINDILENKTKPKDANAFLLKNTWQQRVKNFYEEVITK